MMGDTLSALFRSHSSDVDLFSLYGYNSIYRGKDVPPNGSKILLLFDCSDALVGDAPNTKPYVTEFGPLNSPILASFMAALETDENVIVHVEPWPDSATDENQPDDTTIDASDPNSGLGRHLKKLFNFGMKRNVGLDKTRLVERQIRLAYEFLVTTYELDSSLGPHGKRNSLFFFGDAEGALAANAVARIVADVGILQPYYLKLYVDDAIRHGHPTAVGGTADKFFRSTRCRYAKVELVGLWYDDTTQPPLRPMIKDEWFIGNVVVYSRQICESCRQLTHKDVDERYSGRDACSVQPMIRAFRLLRNDVDNEVLTVERTGEFNRCGELQLSEENKPRHASGASERPTGAKGDLSLASVNGTQSTPAPV